MQIEVPDHIVDALKVALAPILETLVNERVEQRRTLLLSVAGAAEQLCCSRSSVLGLIHGGHLEAVRIGRSYRIATRVLEAYVDELTKPAYSREVVGRGGGGSDGPGPRLRRAASPSAKQPARTAVITATKAPRSPRPAKPKRPSEREVEEGRWTAVEFGERWWGVESANALLERSEVLLSDGADGPPTFRYGDLVDWMREHADEFEAWLEEFDPVFGGRGRRSPGGVEQ